jgi:uncharacterized UPF0146 family protein
MTPNQTIYAIRQSPELLKAWLELSEYQKRAVIKKCERTESDEELEMIIEEVIDGERRLF